MQIDEYNLDNTSQVGADTYAFIIYTVFSKWRRDTIWRFGLLAVKYMLHKCARYEENRYATGPRNARFLANGLYPDTTSIIVADISAPAWR